MDVKKCRDLSVTVLYKSEEADTLAKSEMAVSHSDCPAVSGLRDVRKVVRRRDEPLGSPIKIPARPDSRQEISAPIVDLVTRKCKPGKVSRTVSASPLTIDITVVCTPAPDPVQPGVVAHELPPTEIVQTSVTGFDTSTPFVATPAMGGEQIPQVIRPVRIFGIATVVWAVVLVLLTYVAVGGSVSERSERGSLFNVSPFSPEIVIQPTRENGTT